MPHGSISKVGKTYRVCFDYGKDEAGKRTRKYKTFKTKKEADMALARHDVSMEDGSFVRPRKITVGEWMDYWLNDMYAHRAAETTIYGNRLLIENHVKPFMGHIQLQRLRPSTIQDYYTDLRVNKGLSANSIIKHHDMLNIAFKAAVKHEYIMRNPVQGVDRPKKTKQEVNIYTPEQMKRLLKICELDRLETTIKLGAYLGLRREEICGLKWEDIDWENQTLFICRARTQVGTKTVEKETKTYASTRKLYIPDALLDTLEKEKAAQDERRAQLPGFYQDTPYVVVMEDGKPYRPNYVSELFTKFLAKNDMPKIVLHELRHTFASLSNEAGIQEFNIGKALGHANVSTTKKIYTHLFDDKHTKAVEAVAELIEGKKE